MEGLTSAEVKRIGVSFVESMKVVRVKTLVRLLQHYSSFKTENTWSSFVSRMVKSSELVYLQRGGKDVDSIIGTSDVKLRPMLEVQHAHELRVAEVAVEFIRQGFEWIPPVNSGVGASKVSDGTAWLGDARVEVEVELSPKNQRRWSAVIDRYRKKQESAAVGVSYVFGNDGLRRSFRNIMAEKDTPGWWYLGLNSGETLEERQAADSDIASKAKQAIIAGDIRATDSTIGEPLSMQDEVSPPPHESAEQAPARVETRAERLRREFEQQRQRKLENPGQE